MKEAQVLGKGCPKCTALLEKVERIAKETGIEIKLDKVSEVNEISKYGVMLTPALVIDGVVKTEGRVPDDELIKNLLRE